MSEPSVHTRGRLAALGAYGFGAQEPIILAPLVSGDPILLVGRSGTGKTFRAVSKDILHCQERVLVT